MDLRLVTVAFDPETGGFPEQPLKGVEGEIVSVVEHFFHHAQQPHLLLVVHLRPPADARRRFGRRKRGAGVREMLSPDEAELFDRLRAWRNGFAQTEGIPPYVILTNQQLAEVARRRPGDSAALREIHGIGEAKAGRFGKEILQVLAHGVGSTPSTQGKGGGSRDAT